MVDKRKGSKTERQNVTPEQAQQVIGKEDFYLCLKIKICSELEQMKTLDRSAKEQLATIRNNIVNQLQFKHKRLAHAYVRRWLVNNEQPARLRGVMEYDDMVDEAMFGLRIALERFNPLLGIRISTYAEAWMRRSLQQGIATALGLTISANRRISRLKAAFASLSEQLNRVPSEDELMDELKINRKVYERIQRSQRSAITCYSLDEPVPSDDGDAQPLGALEADRHAPEDIDTRLHPTYLRAALEKVMREAGLTKQEDTVIRKLFGLADGQIKNLRQAGECLGLTKERVRQIKNQALEKLQTEEILTALAPLLN